MLIIQAKQRDTSLQKFRVMYYTKPDNQGPEVHGDLSLAITGHDSSPRCLSAPLGTARLEKLQTI